MYISNHEFVPFHLRASDIFMNMASAILSASEAPRRNPQNQRSREQPAQIPLTSFSTCLFLAVYARMASRILRGVAQIGVVSLLFNSSKENVAGSDSLLPDRHGRLIGKDRGQAASRQCQKLLCRIYPRLFSIRCYTACTRKSASRPARRASAESKVTHAEAG